MQVPILFIKEKINGVWESNADRDRYILEDGHFEGDFNLQGEHLRIYFEKGTSTDNGTMSTCYIDNLIITQNSLEIVEEHNYYPFGLKHKGYNNQINGLENKRFTFQGQEFSDELNLNWFSFKWRNHDPSIGRFFNIDPLAESYVHNSTYAFSENRVIDGVELEGLEYVNANKARIFIKPNSGDIALRMENMTEGTAYPFRQANKDRSTWTSNSMGNRYINTTIGSLSWSGLSSKYENIRGILSQTHKIEPPIAKSTGLPDKRFKKRTAGHGNVIGPKESRAAKTFIIIEGIKFTGSAIGFFMKLYDRNQTYKHLDLLNLASEDLSNAYQDGLIPEKFHNSEDFNDLLNVIFSGFSVSENSELENLGIKIYNHYNKPTKKDSPWYSIWEQLNKQAERQIENGALDKPRNPN